MIKYQSFKLSDSDGINELLSKNTIANGQPVFSNSGEILIPYEDGSQLNKEQVVTAHKEEINKKLQELDVILFVQHKYTMQVQRINVQIEGLQAELDAIEGKSKDNYDAKKLIVDRMSNLKNARDQKSNQLAMNSPEITDIMDEIEVRKLMIDAVLKEGVVDEAIEPNRIFTAVSENGKTQASGKTQEEADERVKSKK